MDVKYIPQDWEKTEEGIGNLVGLGKWGKGVIDKLKKLDDIMEDAKDSIGEYDVDGVVHLQHTSQKSKYQDLYEDYEVLHDFSEKVGELIDTEIDQPFYEDIDAFAQAMRDLTIEKYTTSNTIGAKETIATPMGGSYVQTTERVKDKITVNDIFSSNNVFATNLKAEFEAYMKEHPKENVSYTTYQKAALNSRAFTYDSIKDQQQNKEFWRDIAILGTTIVLAVATPFFPPAGIALGALVTSVGAMELSSAATGKDWMTGRKLDTSERWLRGVLAFVDVLPAAKGLHAFGNVTTGLKAGTSTTTIKNASKVGLEEGGSRLKQADNLLTERAQNANKLSGEQLEDLSLNIEKKTPVENAPAFEKKSAEFFDGLNLKSGATEAVEVEFLKENIYQMNSFQESVDSILKNEGVTLDEFHSMRMKLASELTDEQRRIMVNVREAVPTPNSDTILQKVFDGGKIENYLKEDEPWNTVGGFVTRAQDVKQLSTLKDVYDGLRLDYNGTPFKVGMDKDYGIIRFKTDEVEKMDIPYGPSMEGIGAKPPTNGFDNSPDPFTGHGFTKDINGNIIPEYTIPYLKPNQGAELFRVDSITGAEELIAKFINGRFVNIK